MNYRIYVYSYNYGWDLYSIVNTKEEARNITSSFKDYEAYMIIQHNKQLNSDQVIELEFLQNQKRNKTLNRK